MQFFIAADSDTGHRRIIEALLHLDSLLGSQIRLDPVCMGRAQLDSLQARGLAAVDEPWQCKILPPQIGDQAKAKSSGGEGGRFIRV